MPDPFAGGGAIPLEARRLGCEAVAADINPGGVVHPALHAPPSALAVRGGTAVAVVRATRSGFGRASTPDAYEQGGVSEPNASNHDSIRETRRSEEERWAIDAWPRVCQREKALPVRRDTMRAGRPRTQERS